METLEERERDTTALGMHPTLTEFAYDMIH